MTTATDGSFPKGVHFRPMEIDNWDPEDPLARVQGEAKKANTALRDYYYMGPGRSLMRLISRYRESQGTVPTKRYQTLAGWSSRQRWQARVAAREALDDLDDKQRWDAYRSNIREKEREGASKLYSLAEKILDEGPRFTKTTRRVIPAKLSADGTRVLEPEREVITVALDAALAIKALELFSKLARSSAGMDQRVLSMDIDLSQLSTGQLERLAAGEDPLLVLADGANMIEGRIREVQSEPAQLISGNGHKENGNGKK